VVAVEEQLDLEVVELVVIYVPKSMFKEPFQ
jgi:hypothetical protein